MSQTAPPAGTQAIRRAANILHEIGRAATRGVTIAELARALPIERPTLHRILACLQVEGLVGRDARTKRFFLGRILYSLGQSAAPRFELREICAPALNRIAARSNDAVFLITLDGDDGLVLDARDAQSPARATPLRPGMRRPLGVGAGGLAILMEMSDDRIHTFLSENIRRLREHNVRADRLLPSLQKFRARGYAISRGYGQPGLCGLAIPLRDLAGAPIGALSVTAPTPRMTPQHQAEVLSILQTELATIEPRLLESLA